MRTHVLIALALLALAAICFPFDKPISDFFRHTIDTSGDIRRELEAFQQFGQTTVMLLCALIIALLDPPNRRRLLDLALAAGLVALVVKGIKMTAGRARPALEDPSHFIGWTTSDKFWSMPSSHTAYAVVLAVFLAVLYPRLRWLVGVLACVVAFGRLHFGAHYPSDVFVGAGVAYLLSIVVLRYALGIRLLDVLWQRLVDRNATPIYPRFVARKS